MSMKAMAGSIFFIQAHKNSTVSVCYGRMRAWYGNNSGGTSIGLVNRSRGYDDTKQ